MKKETTSTVIKAFNKELEVGEAFLKGDQIVILVPYFLKIDPNEYKGFYESILDSGLNLNEESITDYYHEVINNNPDIKKSIQDEIHDELNLVYLSDKIAKDIANKLNENEHELVFNIIDNTKIEVDLQPLLKQLITHGLKFPN